MRTDLRGFLARTGGWRGLLCVAPHPDDESAGCGGLLAGAARVGVPVSVVVTTDGAASHQSRTWPKERLAARRRAELAAALDVLGVRRPARHLDLRDAGTPTAVETRRAERDLAAIMRRARPGLVLVTWRREPHGDHRQAAALVRAAAAAMQVRTAEYVVWTPLTGRPGDAPGPGEGEPLDLVLSARDRQAKRAALACHRSQHGEVVTDDPGGFALTSEEVGQMTGPIERYRLT